MTDVMNQKHGPCRKSSVKSIGNSKGACGETSKGKSGGVRKGPSRSVSAELNVRNNHDHNDPDHAHNQHAGHDDNNDNYMTCFAARAGI